MKPKILVAIPHNYPMIDTEFFRNFIKIICQYPYVNYMLYSALTIDLMRNKIAEVAVKDKFDYVLMLDSDMIYPHDIIQRLLDHKKDIVGGLYFLRRVTGTEPSIWNKSKVNDKYESIKRGRGLLEVDFVATGGILIKTEVFKKIGWPFFKIKYFDGRFKTEDVYFCEKAKAAGYKLYADTDLVYRHLVKGFLAQKETKTDEFLCELDVATSLLAELS